MQIPLKPADERTRLDTLRSLNIPNTVPEEHFDRLTCLARRLFNVRVALVSLVDADRQWFKWRAGLSVSETPRDVAFCGRAILGEDILLVSDALADERFQEHPLVTGEPKVRFYAGCPLRVPGGGVMGTLCLIDDQPRELGEEDRALLRDLASMAKQEIAAFQLATTDELTKLSNRRGFDALAQHALKVRKRTKKPASLLYIDLSDFRKINDTYAHAEGDRALAVFGDLLRTTLRDCGVIGRLAGDEFAALRRRSSALQAALRCPAARHCAISAAHFVRAASRWRCFT